MRAEMHPVEDLQLLVEGRLPKERNAALDTHLEGCVRCRAELDALKRVRSTLRASLTNQPVPEEVSKRILAAIEAEARASGHARPETLDQSRRVFIKGAGALAIAAGLVALFFQLRPRGPIAAAAADVLRFASEGSSLDLTTSDPSELETFFRTRDLGFSARVFDFGMMDYLLEGGSVSSISGRDSALFAYRGADGRGLVCQMYPGSLGDLEETAPEQVINGIDFRVYERDELTLVFWEEGPIVCVLGAEEEPASALDLAVAKAVRV
jgi:anti-sigma factor RsiW